MTIITSKANSVVKNAKKLHQKKYRKSAYLIEGWHLFEEAVQAGVTIEKIFALENYRNQLAAFPQTVWISEDILLDLADSQTPQGIVAVVQKEEVGQADLSQGKFLFLEDVQDPGNVGTIIRTADAAGFTGVIVSDKSADIYSLKTLRSMQGSHFHLPIYRMTSQALLDETKKVAIPVLATTLSKDSVDYRELPSRELPSIENFVLVMGNEGQGISPLMAESADQLVHISMKGQAESLNVAVAAGILIFYLS
ncbi:TPA: RNA methyltransferase [Streptococcus pneumoniae]|nr:RNA methyltransferase [Streptococcus pneumoniae]